jgi:LPS sulfotransferase NodH
VLADGLSSTGYVGHPAEYFDIHAANQMSWAYRLGIHQPAEYLDKVIAAGSTPNGFFGLKIHWHQIPAMVSAFAYATGQEDAKALEKPLDEWLKSRFDASHFLWLGRRNKVAQGISYYRSTQQAANGHGGTHGGAAAFDLNEIDRHIKLIEDSDDQWLAFFKQREIRALELFYEDFIENYEAAIREICTYLGVGAPQAPIAAMGCDQQADATSLEWEQEYLRLKQQAGTADGVPVNVRAQQRRRRREASPTDADGPQLIAYDLSYPHKGIDIVGASGRRDWMDATHERFAYRCLPLVIANQHGWLLLNPSPIKVIWDGRESLDALTIEYAADEPRRFAASHFGCGILTFSMNFIFRTPPGVSLHSRGPANMPKDGIYPLEGIIETDWAEATFTMNWKMTRTGHPVVFEKDEPFAMLTPVTRGDLERYRPEIRLISDNPALESGVSAWTQSRAKFIEEQKAKGSAGQRIAVQRHYTTGETVTYKKASDHHPTVTLSEFADKRE